MGDPLSIRYNNPGAVEYKPWMSQYGGRVGANGRYAQFDTPDQGYSVMDRILGTYEKKHGINTVSGIVNRWAPPTVDNNSTPQYIAHVAKSLGIDPNQPLTPEQRPALMRAMASYEAGRAPAPLAVPSGPYAGGSGPAPGSFRAAQDMPPSLPPSGPYAGGSGPASGSFRAAQEMPEPTGPMMLGGPKPGDAPMPKEQAPAGLPGLLGALENGMMSPLFRMGLGTVNAGAQGINPAGGLLAGAQGYQQQRAAELANRQHEMAVQQMEQGRNYVNNLDPNDPIFKGLPPGLISMARGMGDPSILAKAYAGKMDLDQQERLARMQGDIATANKILEIKAKIAAEKQGQIDMMEMADRFRRSRQGSGSGGAVRRYNPATGEIE